MLDLFQQKIQYSALGRLKTASLLPLLAQTEKEASKVAGCLLLFNIQPLVVVSSMQSPPEVFLHHEATADVQPSSSAGFGGI